MAKRRNGLAVLLAALMCVGLVACAPADPKTTPSNEPAPAADSAEPAGKVSEAPSEQPTEAPTPEPAKVDSLRVVTMFGGTDPHKPVYEGINAKYTEATGTKIEDESSVSTEDWKASVINDFNADNEPDVLFYFNGTDAKSMIEGGKVVDIATIRAEFPDYAKDVYPSVLETIAVDGKTYEVPINGFWEGLFCNKKLFEDNGLELPTDWEKFTKAIEVFSAKGITPIAASLGQVPHYWIEHLILAQGGMADHMVNPKSEAEIPESWGKAIDLFKTLYDMKAFPKDTMSSTDEVTQLLFLTGKAAMQLDGSWMAGKLATEPGTENVLYTDVTVLPMPTPPDGKGNGKDIISGSSSGWYITAKAWADASKRQALVDYVNMHVSKEAIAAYCAPEIGGVPAADVPTDAYMGVNKDGLALLAGAAAVDGPIDSRMGKDAWQELVLGISKVATGKQSSADLLKSAIAKNQ